MKQLNIFFALIIMGCCLVVQASNTTPSDAGVPLSWSALDGGLQQRPVSPSGDILNSNMDALSPLQVAPINIPTIGLVPTTFQKPALAARLIQATLFMPVDPQEAQKMTPQQLEEMRLYQKQITDQTSAYALAFGVKSDHNAAQFAQRRDQAIKFINSAETMREDVQVLNGIALGQLSETNKILGMLATEAILSASKDLRENNATRYTFRK